MAEELGSAYIELGAKVPSAAEVQKQVDETERMYRDAIARASQGSPGGSFDPDDPGVAALRAQIAARHAQTRVATAAARGPGWMSAADALASGQFGGGTPSTSNPAFSMPKWINPPGKEKSDLEKQRDALQEALRPIRMKEEIRGLEKELAKSNTTWGRFSETLSKAGMGTIGLGTAAAVIGGIGVLGSMMKDTAQAGTAFGNPVLHLQFEQARRDALGAMSKNLNPLAQGAQQRERDKSAIASDPNSFWSKVDRNASAFWNRVEQGWHNMLGMGEDAAAKARAQGYTGVGAGLNPMLGHKMSSDDAFDMMMQATLQMPVGQKITAQEQEIIRMQETTKALEDFATQIRATIRTMYPQSVMP